MPTVSAETLSQILIWIVVLGGLVVVAVTVVRRFRGQGAEDRQDPSTMLTKFQEMRQEGDISDTEYRTIKAVLGANLQREVKRGEDKI